MLNAYFDDSGNLGDRNVFVLAGYVSSVEKWSAFSDEWKAELEAVSLPYFKMREVHSRKRPFNGLTPETAVALTRRLIGTINRHALMGIICMFKNEDYLKCIKGRVPENMDDPYFFLFRNVISQLVLAQHALGAYEATDFCFDIQSKDPAETKRMYDLVRFTCRPEMRQVMGAEASFRDDRTVLPLQAADLLAWQFRRYSDESLVAGTRLSPTDALIDLHAIPLSKQIYSADDLNLIVTGSETIAALAKTMTPEQATAAISELWARFDQAQRSDAKVE